MSLYGITKIKYVIYENKRNRLYIRKEDDLVLGRE